MSKARGQSMKRAISRGSKGRGNRPPRILAEFVDTLQKLIILKRPSSNNSKTTHVRRSGNMFTKNKKPYYYIAGRV